MMELVLKIREHHRQLFFFQRHDDGETERPFRHMGVNRQHLPFHFVDAALQLRDFIDQRSGVSAA